MRKNISSKLHTDNRPIGIFDSGLGGLTVVRSLIQAMPNETVFYLGDTARVPYGNKSVETIIQYGCEDVQFLIQKGVKAVIVACNTVSAVAMPELRRCFPNIPILGVLDAGVQAILLRNPQSVTIIGTRATISSDAYRIAIHQKDPSIVVKSVACPLFVPIVEEGLNESLLAEAAVHHYLTDFLKKPTNLLLLGCTHYPLLNETFRRLLPEDTQIIDSAQACAEYAVDYFQKHQIEATPGQIPNPRFYVTDFPMSFIQQAVRFLGHPVQCEKINLKTFPTSC